MKMVSAIQFAEVQGNGDEACDSFNAFSWRGSESTHNPEGCPSPDGQPLLWIWDGITNIITHGVTMSGYFKN